MWDGAVTPVLESLLVTRKDISRPVGAGKLGMGAGDAGGGFPQRPLTDAPFGELRIRLVANNTALRQRTAGAVPSLKIVDRE